MNRNELVIEPVDIIAVERQARAMQAQVMAEMLAAAKVWMLARLRRAPGGQTA
ncbi:MAG: hypothetical protein JJU19_03735 [Pararhodobacter sp.]|nr:hypothetical protein [Pararhodobacter sp.]